MVSIEILASWLDASNFQLFRNRLRKHFCDPLCYIVGLLSLAETHEYFAIFPCCSVLSNVTINRCIPFPLQEKKVEEPTRVETTPEPAPPSPVTPVSPGPVTIGGIEFAGSVAEAKARASRKKKNDPRVDSTLTMKDKFDMFQRL